VGDRRMCILIKLNDWCSFVQGVHSLKLLLRPRGADRDFKEQKIGLARRLREETTVSIKWIAQRLQMGTWTDLTTG
jgi:hypothetical protein